MGGRGRWRGGDAGELFAVPGNAHPPLIGIISITDRFQTSATSILYLHSPCHSVFGTIFRTAVSMNVGKRFSPQNLCVSASGSKNSGKKTEKRNGSSTPSRYQSNMLVDSICSFDFFSERASRGRPSDRGAANPSWEAGSVEQAQWRDATLLRLAVLGLARPAGVSGDRPPRGEALEVGRFGSRSAAVSRERAGACGRQQVSTYKPRKRERQGQAVTVRSEVIRRSCRPERSRKLAPRVLWGKTGIVDS